MDDRDRDEIRRRLRRYTAANTVSRETALAAMVRSGFLTPEGELTPEYGGPQPAIVDKA
jgi:hypothetical protein